MGGALPWIVPATHNSTAALRGGMLSFVEPARQPERLCFVWHIPCPDIPVPCPQKGGLRQPQHTRCRLGNTALHALQQHDGCSADHGHDQRGCQAEVTQRRTRASEQRAAINNMWVDDRQVTHVSPRQARLHRGEPGRLRRRLAAGRASVL